MGGLISPQTLDCLANNQVPLEKMVEIQDYRKFKRLKT
jgi:hypothetical protein